MYYCRLQPFDDEWTIRVNDHLDLTIVPRKGESLVTCASETTGSSGIWISDRGILASNPKPDFFNTSMSRMTALATSSGYTAGTIQNYRIKRRKKHGNLVLQLAKPVTVLPFKKYEVDI
ncbi:hypothetical protein HUJ04_007125 [Dendroctonus ponderosae]|nr:hypothetical protein HUJ04_007125 [Dendroctonus ponderosae]